MCTLFFLTACSFNSYPLSYVSDFQQEALLEIREPDSSWAVLDILPCETDHGLQLSAQTLVRMKSSCTVICLELQFTKSLGLVINEFNFLHSPRLQLPYNWQEAWTLP